MATSTLLLSLLLLSTTTIAAASTITSQALRNAAAALSNTTFISMSIILSSTGQSLISSTFPSSGFTVFAPSDAAFSEAGQPPLSLLLYHFVPKHHTPDSLRSLLPGSKLPTLNSNLSLTTTAPSAASHVTLNGVTIPLPPLFDDGSLAVYAATTFLDPNSQPPQGSGATLPVHCKNPAGGIPGFTGAGRMRAMGYSTLAAFLELEMEWGRREATVFAPADEALGVNVFAGNSSEYVTMLRRHVVPCRIQGGELARLAVGNGAELATLMEGFAIGVGRSEERAAVNGVPVADVEVYADEWVVVHGIRDVLKPSDTVVEFGH